MWMLLGEGEMKRMRWMAESGKGVLVEGSVRGIVSLRCGREVFGSGIWIWVIYLVAYGAEQSSESDTKVPSRCESRSRSHPCNKRRDPAI